MTLSINFERQLAHTLPQQGGHWTWTNKVFGPTFVRFALCVYGTPFIHTGTHRVVVETDRRNVELGVLDKKLGPTPHAPWW